MSKEPEAATVTRGPRPRTVGLEPVLIAAIAACGLSLPLVHAVVLLARRAASDPSEPSAAAVTWTMVVVAGAFAGAQLVVRRRASLPWAGAAISLVAAAFFVLQHWGTGAAGTALLVVGTLQTLAAMLIAGRLPSPFSGALHRRPIVSLLWGMLAVLFLVQNGRLSTYMADPAVDWWLTTRHEFWARHMCMPAYIEAADLHRQGVANVYAAEHYAALVRSAKPALTVRNMEAFAGDPYQYPPQFLLLPYFLLELTDDFLTLRTLWYAVQALGFVLVALALSLWVGGAVGVASILLIPATWASVPALQSLQYGQVHLAAIAIAIGGMLAFEKGRGALGGALLAAATLAKIFPGLLLVYLVARRQWRAVGWTVGFGAGLSLAALVLLGPQPFRSFFEYQLPRVASGEAFDFAREYPELGVLLTADNFSPAGVVDKLRQLGLPGATPGLGRLALSGYSLLLLILAYAAGRRGGSRRDRACLWLAVLNLAALSSPTAFADYVTVGSVWILALLPDLYREHPGRSASLLVCWVFFAFVPGIPPVPGWMPAPAMMVLTTVGALLLIGFNIWVIVRAPKGQPLPGHAGKVVEARVEHDLRAAPRGPMLW